MPNKDVKLMNSVQERKRAERVGRNEFFGAIIALNRFAYNVEWEWKERLEWKFISVFNGISAVNRRMASLVYWTINYFAC